MEVWLEWVRERKEKWGQEQLLLWGFMAYLYTDGNDPTEVKLRCGRKIWWGHVLELVIDWGLKSGGILSRQKHASSKDTISQALRFIESPGTLTKTDCWAPFTYPYFWFSVWSGAQLFALWHVPRWCWWHWPGEKPSTLICNCVEQM